MVFRLNGVNELTKSLLQLLNERGNLYCIPSELKGKFVIRFTITSSQTTDKDVLKDWLEIQEAATQILNETHLNSHCFENGFTNGCKKMCE